MSRFLPAVQNDAVTGYCSYMALQHALNELDEDSKPETKEQPDVRELATLLEPFNVRSIALTGIFILALFFTLKVASSFFIPVVLAILLNFVFASTIRTLGRLWIPPPLAAFIVLGCLIGSVAFGIYQLAGPARAWMGKLPETAQQIERKFSDLKRSMREVTKAGQEVDRLTNLGNEKTQKVEVRKPSFGETLLAPTQDFIIGTGTVLILLFFLLASGDLFLRKLVTVLPRFEDKKTAVEISRQIERDISAYLFSICLINAFFGTAIGTAMYFLGLPNPLLWGVMAGLLHFIPFLGAVVGISIVTLVAAITLDTVGSILLVPATYLGLNLLEEYVCVPLVIGRRLMLNPVVLFIWLIFWGWLWSVPGALMAVPLLAIVKIFCDHVKPLAAIAEFIGD
jgi:predicted PurR-regulated permease PerM